MCVRIIDIVIIRLIDGTLQMPCWGLLVLLVPAAKIHSKEGALVAGTKQSRQTDKAGRLTRQAD
jgi:hypothetical protein